MKPHAFLFVIPLVAVPALAQPPSQAQHLTFQTAIELALGQHPDLSVAREAIAGAEAHTDAIKARRLPTLGLNASGNLWREPYALEFGGSSFVLHERETTATSVTLNQPLSGLGLLSKLIAGAEHETSVARHDYDRARLDIAYRTAESYIRVLEARARADVAHRSVADIQSGLDRAVQLRQAEAYTDIDVLRFKSAKAAADQGALRADTAIDATLAELTVQLGLHDGAPVELSDDLPATPPPPGLTLEQAQARALEARPELGAARDKIAIAETSRISAWSRYFPDIRAVGVWQHLTGVQPFQPENEEYVGLTLAWNLWDWGATHHAVVEAEHARSRAEITATTLGDQIRLDVRKHWLEAKTAYDSLASAQVQQQTAEEAYRLQKVRFDNAAATTTDVLDAETDVARARLTFAVARYDYYLALVGLSRSVGKLPGL